MPPRGNRNQNEEQRAQAFETFKASEEYKLMEWIFEARTSGEAKYREIKALQNGTEDIVEDWKQLLDNLHKLCELMKVPGRKAKSKCKRSPSRLTRDARRRLRLGNGAHDGVQALPGRVDRDRRHQVRGD